MFRIFSVHILCTFHLSSHPVSHRRHVCVYWPINNTWYYFFYVLLTVHLSIFMLVINQLDAQNLFYNKFVSYLYMFREPCSHHQGVKIVLYSLWFHHTETSEWSQITKMYKYEHIVLKFTCEFFGCDYCLLLTIRMLWHVEVMFIQLFNLLERYYEIKLL